MEDRKQDKYVGKCALVKVVSYGSIMNNSVINISVTGKKATSMNKLLIIVFLNKVN